MKQIVRIGLDIAKSVFQLHGVDSHGKPVCKKTLSRGEVLTFFVSLPSCLIGIEACAGSHYWARELIKLGHDARLMAAQFVSPFFLITIAFLEAIESHGIPTLQGSPDGWPIPTQLGWFYAGAIWWAVWLAMLAVVLLWRSRRL